MGQRSATGLRGWAWWGVAGLCVALGPALAQPNDTAAADSAVWSQVGDDPAAWLEQASVQARRVTGVGEQLTTALQLKGELLAHIAVMQEQLGQTDPAARNRQLVQLCVRALGHSGDDGWVHAAQAQALAAAGDETGAAAALDKITRPAERQVAEMMGDDPADVDEALRLAGSDISRGFASQLETQALRRDTRDRATALAQRSAEDAAAYIDTLEVPALRSIASIAVARVLLESAPAPETAAAPAVEEPAEAQSPAVADELPADATATQTPPAADATAAETPAPAENPEAVAEDSTPKSVDAVPTDEPGSTQAVEDAAPNQTLAEAEVPADDARVDAIDTGGDDEGVAEAPGDSTTEPSRAENPEAVAEDSPPASADATPTDEPAAPQAVEDAAPDQAVAESEVPTADASVDAVDTAGDDAVAAESNADAISAAPEEDAPHSVASDHAAETPAVEIATPVAVAVVPVVVHEAAEQDPQPEPETESDPTADIEAEPVAASAETPSETPTEVAENPTAPAEPRAPAPETGVPEAEVGGPAAAVGVVDPTPGGAAPADDTDPIPPADPAPAVAETEVVDPALPPADPAVIVPRLRVLAEPDQVLDEDPAPAVYDVKITTTRGAFVVRVHRDWAPAAADRFHDLARAGFYHNQRFFRVVPGFVAQWGIHGFPKVAAAWRSQTFPDEPRTQPNARGTIAFAAAATPDTRTTQVYVNLTDNDFLDDLGFAPFGEVVEGMEIVEQLFGGYGEAPSEQQREIQLQGNALLDELFPELDSIVSVRVDESE